jgi:hypothetical protein
LSGALPIPHAETNARLEVTILDLHSEHIVWRGSFSADVWSTWSPEKAVLELSDLLAKQIAFSAL